MELWSFPSFNGMMTMSHIFKDTTSHPKRLRKSSLETHRSGGRESGATLPSAKRSTVDWPSSYSSVCLAAWYASSRPGTWKQRNGVCFVANSQ